MNDLIKKWATELTKNFFKRKNLNGKIKTHEKMFTIPGHKGNANQNHTKIPSHSC
jgi:hypothetical protein